MPDQGLLDVLRRSGGLVAVASQLEIAPAAALAVAEALMPLVRGGFRRRVERYADLSTGLAELLAMIEAQGGGKLASSVLQREPIDQAVCSVLLAEVIGPHPLQELVIADVAGRSGCDPAIARQVLPLLVLMAAGYVSAKAGRMSPAERLAELGPLLDLDGQPNPLDALGGIAEQSSP